MENEHKECEGKDGGFGDSAVFTGRYRLLNIAYVPTTASPIQRIIVALPSRILSTLSLN